MKKFLIGTVLSLTALGPLSWTKNAVEAKAEQDRLENAGKVMQEILAVPDDIPQDLIDKARCVIVMPSVLKAAFVVGGSYGRGAMVCRTRKDFGLEQTACATVVHDQEHEIGRLTTNLETKASSFQSIHGG